MLLSDKTAITVFLCKSVLRGRKTDSTCVFSFANKVPIDFTDNQSILYVFTKTSNLSWPIMTKKKIVNTIAVYKIMV